MAKRGQDQLMLDKNRGTQTIVKTNLHHKREGLRSNKRIRKVGRGMIKARMSKIGTK
jgi:hypothetical protein